MLATGQKLPVTWGCCLQLVRLFPSSRDAYAPLVHEDFLWGHAVRPPVGAAAPPVILALVYLWSAKHGRVKSAYSPSNEISECLLIPDTGSGKGWLEVEKTKKKKKHSKKQKRPQTTVVPNPMRYCCTTRLTARSFW